jgi:hypothetical protein
MLQFSLVLLGLLIHLNLLVIWMIRRYLLILSSPLPLPHSSLSPSLPSPLSLFIMIINFILSHFQLEQYKKESKRGSFKKSMSVSGGMGFNTIPNRDMMPSSSGSVRLQAQSVFRKSMFARDRERMRGRENT